MRILAYAAEATTGGPWRRFLLLNGRFVLSESDKCFSVAGKYCEGKTFDLSRGATGIGVLFLFAVFWLQCLKSRERRTIQSKIITAIGESAVINTRSTQDQPENIGLFFFFKSIVWLVPVKLAHTR